MLVTQRLVLRQYDEKMREDFCRLLCDPVVMKYADGELSNPTAGQLFDKILSLSFKDCAWGVFNKSSNNFIGHTALVSRGNKSKEFLIYIHQKYWGEGIATETALKLLEYAQEEFRSEELIATVDFEHKASLNLCKKMGFSKPQEMFDDLGKVYIFKMNLDDR